MAEQTNPEQTDPQTATTEPTQPPDDTNNVLITQVDETETTDTNNNGKSAAENYHEVAATIFESPEGTSVPKSDDVNKETADTTDKNTNMMENNKDGEKEKIDDQIIPSEPSKDAEQVDSPVSNLTPPAITVEQVHAEDGPATGDNDDANGNKEQVEQTKDIQDENKQEDGGVADGSNFTEETKPDHLMNEKKSDGEVAEPIPDSQQVNNAAVDSAVAVDNTIENNPITAVDNDGTPAVDSNAVADNVTSGLDDIAVVGTAVAVDSNRKLSEDDIIQRLQEVNQQVYTDDDNKTAPDNEHPNSNAQPGEPSKDTTDADGPNKAEPSGEDAAGDGVAEDGSLPAAPDAGGDTGPVPPNDAGDADIDEGIDNTTLDEDDGLENVTVHTDNINTNPTAPVSEVMSEDLDAMPVSDLYRNYAGKEEEAAISETEAAISEGEQPQQNRPHHVTYADLPGQKGALSDSSQVCVSKRSHAQVAHQCRGPSRLPGRMPPQTAPSIISSMHSTTKSVHIPKIPSPPGSDRGGREDDERKLHTRNSHKLPPSLMRMSTVMVSARKRAILNRQASVYFEETTTPKVVTLDQCINSRPPLPYDLDTPGPWHYSPRNKPLYETNAPEYSMGCKFYERGGGGRTAWGKTWYNSPDNFTTKVRWEKRWPSPANYSARSPLLGRPQARWKTYPQFSIGVRANFSISKRGSENEPSPCQYNRDKADHLVMRSAPSFSMAQRTTKTTLGKTIESTPSPSAYTPAFKHMSSHVHYPSFTIRGVRKQKIHALTGTT